MARPNSTELASLHADEQLAGGISKLAKLLRGRRHFRRSSIGRGDGEVPFVWMVLSGSEKQEAAAGALVRFKELGIPNELRSYTDLEDELTWQVIARAMRDPDVPGTEFAPYPNQLAPVEEIRELTVDERDILYSEYADLEEEVDPDPLKMSQDWHAEIESALKKTPPDVRALSNFGSRIVIGYLLTTVRPRLISPTGNSESLPPEIDNETSQENPTASESG
jgi:hypothetical protein